MKKITIVVVVLVLLLVGAPWGIGKLAEKHVNAGLDQFVEAAPYLTIVERKWTPGWFRSEQDVTFEVLGPWTGVLNQALTGDVADATVAAAAAAAATAPRYEDAAAGAGTVETEVEGPQADGDTPPEATPPPAAPVEPLRFTVRNEILHGPVLWPLSLGVAKVHSKLVLSGEIRKQLVELFGTDEPVRIDTRVGFLGGGVTRISSEAREITTDAGTRLSWDRFVLDVGYSRNFDEIEADGEWPRLEIGDAGKGERLLLEDMEIESRSKRIRGELYDTDFDFTIDDLSMTGADQARMKVDDVRYTADTRFADDFVDVAARFGSGDVTSKELTELGIQLEEVHYDFTLRHLHAETLEKIVSTVKATYTRPVESAAELEATVMSPMKQHALELLTHEPELVIDRIGVVTPEGNGTVTGVLRLKGVTAEDLSVGTMGLIGKIEADITIEVAQKLVDKFPNGATAAGTAVDGGYAKRDGDKLVTRIEFKQGQFTINGKSQGIPGFGGPPGGQLAPPPGDSEEPPQE